MSNFRISGTGLDTSNLTYFPRVITDDNTTYDYFYTNVGANNGLIVRTLIDSSSANDSSLIVGVDFLDHVSNAVGDHLEELLRSHADVLMIDASCDWKTYADEINVLLDSGLVRELGIKNPEKLSIEELEVLSESFNIRYIGIDLCPLYYWKDIMDWASKKGMQVLSFNPFGGHLSAPSIIDAFTISYLLNFSAMHSDIVFLTGKDIIFSDTNRTYLNELKGREVADDSIYKIKKNVNKLIKPLKTLGYTSLKLGEELFPMSEPDTLFNPDEFVVSLGSPDNIIAGHGLEIDEEDKPGKAIIEYLSEAYIPKDAKTAKDCMSVIRPKAFEIFRNWFKSEDNWFCANVFLGDLYLFSASREIKKRRWFSPSRVEREIVNYALYYSTSTGFVLRKLQNTDKES